MILAFDLFLKLNKYLENFIPTRYTHLKNQCAKNSKIMINVNVLDLCTCRAEAILSGLR